MTSADKLLLRAFYTGAKWRCTMMGHYPGRSYTLESSTFTATVVMFQQWS